MQSYRTKVLLCTTNVHCETWKKKKLLSIFDQVHLFFFRPSIIALAGERIRFCKMLANLSLTKELLGKFSLWLIPPPNCKPLLAFLPSLVLAIKTVKSLTAFIIFVALLKNANDSVFTTEERIWLQAICRTSPISDQKTPDTDWGKNLYIALCKPVCSLVSGSANSNIIHNMCAPYFVCVLCPDEDCEIAIEPCWQFMITVACDLCTWKMG